MRKHTIGKANRSHELALVVALAGMLGSAAASLAQPLSTAFTYQGRLSDTSGPGGRYDVQFRLFDSLTGGVQVGPTVCIDDQALIDGELFASLDFGDVFDGTRRYLEIRARRDPGGVAPCGVNEATYTTLAPRREMTAVPSALYAVRSGTAALATDTTLFAGVGAASYRNAANLFGLLPDTSLSTNIARRSQSNAFTGPLNTFQGSVGIGTTTPGGLFDVVAPILGAPETDQSNLGGSPISSVPFAWQSFVVTRAGELTAVRLLLTVTSAPSVCVVNLRQGSGASGSILATRSLSIPNLPPEQFFTFDFATPVRVTAGQVLTIQYGFTSGRVNWRVGADYPNGISSLGGSDLAFMTILRPDVPTSLLRADLTGTSTTNLTAAETVTAQRFVGDGMLVTNLDAGNLASGTIPDGRLQGTYSLPVSLTNAGNSFTGSGAGLTDLNASNILTGTLNRDRLPFPLVIVGSTSNPAGTAGSIQGVNSSVERFASGIYGQSTATSGQVVGVFGHTRSSQGVGVYGYASNGGGSTAGGWFDCFSSDGAGVYGTTSAGSGGAGGFFDCNNPTGTALVAYSRSAAGTPWCTSLFHEASGGGILQAESFAVDGNVTGGSFIVRGAGRAVYGRVAAGLGSSTAGYFENSSNAGTAVIGLESAPSGQTIGGKFETRSPNSTTLIAQSTATTGTPTALRATSASTGGNAIEADLSSTVATGYALRAHTAGSGGTALIGLADSAAGTTTGVWGESAGTSGRGVFAVSTAPSGLTSGAYGQASSTSGSGVFGSAIASTGLTNGVYGISASTSGNGVYGFAGANTGLTQGVRGESTSTSGRGVVGRAVAATGSTTGVSGDVSSTSGTAVFGLATATTGATFGGRFESRSPTGIAVQGLASATSAAPIAGRFESRGSSGIGVQGIATDANSTQPFGVWGEAIKGTGVVGYATDAFEFNRGVWGLSASRNGTGVYGEATNANPGPTYGVQGRTSALSDGIGVYGWASNTAPPSPSGRNIGVSGRAESQDGIGVDGFAASSLIGYGGRFEARGTFLGVGVQGWATNSTGPAYGVRGSSTLSNAASYGVYAEGRLGASGTKTFRIDHPQAPTEKFLIHYSHEGSEPQNVYNGVVSLDGSGEAVVAMPDYFASINRAPRYSLTALGSPMPLLHVAQEISAEALEAGERSEPGTIAPQVSFRVAGGVPGGRVSWEVKAIRNDRWVRRYGAPIEAEKQGAERGTHEHPELFGFPVKARERQTPPMHHDQSLPGTAWVR